MGKTWLVDFRRVEGMDVVGLWYAVCRGTLLCSYIFLFKPLHVGELVNMTVLVEHRVHLCVRYRFLSLLQIRFVRSCPLV